MQPRVVEGQELRIAWWESLGLGDLSRFPVLGENRKVVFVMHPAGGAPGTQSFSDGSGSLQPPASNGD